MVKIKSYLLVLFILVVSQNLFAVNDFIPGSEDGKTPVIVYKLGDFIDTNVSPLDFKDYNSSKMANQLIIVELTYSLRDGWLTEIDGDLKLNPQIIIDADELNNLNNSDEIIGYSPNHQDFIYTEKVDQNMTINFVLFCSNGSSFVKMVKNSFYWSFQIQEIAMDLKNKDNIDVA